LAIRFIAEVMMEVIPKKPIFLRGATSLLKWLSLPKFLALICVVGMSNIFGMTQFCRIEQEICAPTLAQMSPVRSGSSDGSEAGLSQETPTPPPAMSTFAVRMNKWGLRSLARSIMNGGDLDARGKDGRSPLHYAVRKDSARKVQALLNVGVDIDAQDNNGQTSLHYAIARGDLGVVRVLLEAGADAAIRDNSGRGVLQCAPEGSEVAQILQGHLNEQLLRVAGGGARVDALINAGAKVDARDERGMTPLHHAATNGNDDAVQALLNAGAEVVFCDGDGRTALQLASQGSDAACSLQNHLDGLLLAEVRIGNNAARIKSLVEAGANTRVCGEDGKVPLHIAVSRDSGAIVDALLRMDADAVHVRDKNGGIPLHYAVKNEALVRALLSAGSECDVLNGEHKTPLVDAVGMQVEGVVRALLEAGAYPFARPSIGDTREAKNIQKMLADRATRCLQEEAQKDVVNLKGIEWLRDTGADVNAVDSGGQSPMQHVVASGKTQAVRILLAAPNCDLTVCGNNGKSLLQLAGDRDGEIGQLLRAALDKKLVDCVKASGCSVKTVEALIRAGADVNVKGIKTATPLHYAVYCAHEEVVRTLLQAGAYPNAVDKSGRAPLHVIAAAKTVCSLSSAEKMIADLLDAGADAALAINDGRTLQQLASQERWKSFQQAMGKQLVREVQKADADGARIRMLLDAGADPNVNGEDGKSALHHAIVRGDSQLAVSLLDKGANAAAHGTGRDFQQCADVFGQEAVSRLKKQFNEQLMASIVADDGHISDLIAAGAEINTTNEDGVTPLHEAVRIGSEDAVRLLVEAGVDPTIPNKRNVTVRDILQERTRITEEDAHCALTRLCNAEKEKRRLGWGEISRERAIRELKSKQEPRNKYYRIAGLLDDALENQLIMAVRENCPERVKKYLDEYTKRRRNLEKSALLHLAAQVGSMELVCMFLEKDMRVAACDTQGKSPLAYARERGHGEVATLLQNELDKELIVSASTGSFVSYDVVKELLEAGADSNAADGMGRTALHHVVSFKTSGYHKTCSDFVSLLLKAGAKVNVADRNGTTPLHQAVKAGSEGVICLLLDAGADPYVVDGDGNTPWHYTAHRRGQVCGLELRQRVNNRLLDAFATGDVNRVRVMLHAGTEINAKDCERKTLLHYAARAGSREIVRLLLERGADLLVRDRQEHAPLFYAVEAGHVEAAQELRDRLSGRLFGLIWVREPNVGVIRTLLEEGVDVGVRDADGSTLLHHAARAAAYGEIVPYVGVIRTLLDAGAEVDARDGDGCTPLHHAARAGSREIVRLLLERGADLLVRDRQEHAPLFYAVEAGHAEAAQELRDGLNGRLFGLIRVREPNVGVIGTLLEAGADVGVRDADGSTPLHHAAREALEMVVTILIRSGADINARDGNGQIPFELLPQRVAGEIRRMLQPAGYAANAAPPVDLGQDVAENDDESTCCICLNVADDLDAGNELGWLYCNGNNDQGHYRVQQHDERICSTCFAGIRRDGQVGKRCPLCRGNAGWANAAGVVVMPPVQ